MRLTHTKKPEDLTEGQCRERQGQAVGAKLRQDPGPRKMLGFLAVVVGLQKTFTWGVITSHVPQKHDSSWQRKEGSLVVEAE